ncbi:MAG: hypothetical protein CFE23_10215 [Flavobacterium sp. BFFFF1]|nr:MAG: hypothetical protein CFE23_10215 [Flavobacterium sp. BFFFF1]
MKTQNLSSIKRIFVLGLVFFSSFAISYGIVKHFVLGKELPLWTIVIPGLFLLAGFSSSSLLMRKN